MNSNINRGSLVAPALLSRLRPEQSVNSVPHEADEWGAMMSLGPIDLPAVAPAARAIVPLARAATRLPQRRNAYDALVQIHELLTEWCVLAERTNGFLLIAHHGQGRGAATDFDSSYGRPLDFYTAAQCARVLGDATDRIMEPKPPFLFRAIPSARRAAARRGLAAELRVYTPQLAAQLKDATNKRRGFARSIRGIMWNHIFTRKVPPRPITIDESAMLISYQDLLRAKNGVANLIRSWYPTPPYPQ
jgi:hypothetical protein